MKIINLKVNYDTGSAKSTMKPSKGFVLSLDQSEKEPNSPTIRGQKAFKETIFKTGTSEMPYMWKAFVKKIANGLNVKGNEEQTKEIWSN